MKRQGDIYRLKNKPGLHDYGGGLATLGGKAQEKYIDKAAFGCSGLKLFLYASRGSTLCWSAGSDIFSPVCGSKRFCALEQTISASGPGC